MGIKAQFEDFGPIAGLVVSEENVEAPGAGQVGVENRSIAVNPADWKVIEGSMQEVFPLTLPVVPGSAAAGVVTGVGEGVTSFSVGDRVLRSGFVGGFRSVAVYPEAELTVIPGSVDFDLAVALPGSAGTGYALVDNASVNGDDIVVVHGAAGGVGSAAVQIAVARGARVIGTASAKNEEYLRSLGAEPIVYGDGLLERLLLRATPTVSIDAVGSEESVAVSTALLAQGTRAWTAVPIPAALAGGVSFVQHRADELQQVLHLAATGGLRYPVTHAFPLRGVQDALRFSRAGHFAGKIVLHPEQR